MPRPLTSQFQMYLHPTQVVALGFAAVILVGALLLSLPIATESGQALSFLDALFTSTSAVCVTGLIVVDTGATFSTFGEIVVMMLIQIGGLGIMTMSTLFALIMGRRISFRERMLLRESMGILDVAGIVRLVRYILLMTFIAEGAGTLLLAFVFQRQYPLSKALYLGLFHSISAFNNAGFDLLSTSFTGYVGDPLANITIMLLIIFGGLGFTVVLELYDRDRSRTSLHTRTVLVATVVLILVGALLTLALEHDNPATMGELSGGGRVWSSLFLSVTPRTAGFNTLATGQLRPATLLVVLVLMWIGGSPGSTAGGVKTTTFMAILATIWGTITGHGETQLFNRRVKRDIVDQAWAIVMISGLVVLITTGILLHTEQLPFLDVVFEATSAFGTVGLSTGITSALSGIGRVVIIVTMYIGRLGPLTLAVAVAGRQKHRLRIRHPEERIMVG